MSRASPAILFNIVALLLCVLPATAFAAESAHSDPSAWVVLYLAIILLAAKAGGDLAIRIGQPAVLGELVVGIVLGNLALVHITALEPIKNDANIDMLARIGVLILLFEVGLESTVGQMLSVGLSAFLVATLGVIVPIGLGWAVGAWLLPQSSIYVHAFLGATLCATSVGITARVLKDIGRSQSTEARIILGAAVIDDVMGLVVLAVVSGIIVAANRGQQMSFGEIGWVLAKALIFLIGSIVIGVYLSPKLFHVASKLKARGVLLAVGLSFCFLLSWLADSIQLAPIVGAFAAGLILEELHFRDFTDRGEHSLKELIEPISSFLVPVFFVLMGMRTDLHAFTEPGVLGLAAMLTLAAIIGKQACALGVIGKGVDRLSVGIGMIPRGEVGLIFANIGLTLMVGSEKVVNPAVYSAIVIMVVVTTMVTPPLLKWSMGRSTKSETRNPKQI